MDPSSLTDEQRRDLARARITWNLRLCERRYHETASLIESAAICAADAGIELDEGIALAVELVPSHRANAAQIGQIFRDTYERRRRD